MSIDLARGLCLVYYTNFRLALGQSGTESLVSVLLFLSLHLHGQRSRNRLPLVFCGKFDIQFEAFVLVAHSYVPLEFLAVS